MLPVFLPLEELVPSVAYCFLPGTPALSPFLNIIIISQLPCLFSASPTLSLSPMSLMSATRVSGILI